MKNDVTPLPIDRTACCLYLDYYGALLSRQQRRALTLYVEDDLSLSEIGDLLKISRQGAHDLVRRASRQLATYEELLGLSRRDRAMYDTLRHAGKALREGDRPAVEQDLQSLADVIGLGPIENE